MTLKVFLMPKLSWCYVTQLYKIMGKIYDEYKIREKRLDLGQCQIQLQWEFVCGARMNGCCLYHLSYPTLPVCPPTFTPQPASFGGLGPYNPHILLSISQRIVSHFVAAWPAENV